MTWLKIIVVLVLIFVVGSPRLARSSGFSNTTASFTQHSIDTALTPFFVHASDLDGDNDIDLFAPGTTDADSYLRLYWYKNNGSQSFTRDYVSESDFGYDRAIPADIDGDSVMDVLASSSTTSNGLVWYEYQSGTSSFSEAQVISNTHSADTLIATDLDGYQSIDVVTAQYNHLTWWENKGSRNLEPHKIGTTARSVFPVDYDMDTHVDLITTEDYKVIWWENDGGSPPQFTNHTLIDTTDPEYQDIQYIYSIVASDFDDDGDIDLAGAGNHKFVLWRNDGNFTFTELMIDSYFEFAEHLRPGDMDNDGDVDLVGAAHHGGIAWYINDGIGSFQKETIIGSSYRDLDNMVVVDVNKDGKSDVVSCQADEVYADESIDWFENGLVTPGNVKQAHFRIGYDKPLDAMTWYDVTDTGAANVPRETNFRVRFQVYNDGGQTSYWQPQLEWSAAASSGFSKVPLSSSSAPFYVTDTGRFSDGATISSSDFALGLGVGTPQSGVAYDTSNPSSLEKSLVYGYYTEIEFNVRANNNAAHDTIYYFRLTDAGIPIDAYEVASAVVEMVGVQGVVSGVVNDTEINGLGNVNVGLDGAVEDSTNSSGEYHINTDPGSYEIEFDLQGYWEMTDTLTIVGGEEVEKNVVMVAKSGCLTSDTSCALSLFKMIPIVGTVTQVADVANIANELCQVGNLYEDGEYTQCAAKIALWLAQAAEVPVISQLLDLAEGARTVECVVDRLDEVGQHLGKVAIAFWDFLKNESGEDTVIVFQLKDGLQFNQVDAAASGGIDFVMTDSQGNTLEFTDDQIKERSIYGSYGLASENGGYTIGIVSQPSADFSLSFSSTVSGNFDFDVILPQGGGASTRLTYNDLHLDPQTIGSLEIDSGSNTFTIKLVSPTSIVEVQPDSIMHSVREVYLPLTLQASFSGISGGWDSDVRVNDTSGDDFQVYPDMTSGPDGTLHAVWEDYRNGEYRYGSDIYYAYSSDRGQTWSADKRVNDDTPGSAAHRKPRITVSPAGDVYVVWQDYRNDPNPSDPSKTSEYYQNPDIYLAKLAKGQIAFGTNVLVYDQGDWQDSPDVVVDVSGIVYVAWYDRTGDYHYGNSLVAKSINSGASFGNPVTADNHTAWALDPRLAVDRANEIISLVYQGHPQYYKPYYTRSTDGGISWSTDRRLDVGESIDWYDATRQIKIAADDAGHIFVIWADERHDTDNCYTGCKSGHDEFDIYGTQSSDGGVNWSSSNVMVNDDSTFAYITYPDVVFTPDGTLVAVWRDQRSGDSNGDIYCAVSTDYGVSWSMNVRVDHAASGFDASWPVIVASPSGKVFALWQDYRNDDWDIYMTQIGSP